MPLDRPVATEEARVPILLTPAQDPILGPIVVLEGLDHLQSHLQLGPAAFDGLVVHILLLFPEVLLLNTRNVLAILYFLFHVLVMVIKQILLYIFFVHIIEVDVGYLNNIAVVFSAVVFSAVQLIAVQDSAVQNSIALNCTILHHHYHYHHHFHL